MKSGGGKSKGSGWERNVCRELSLWISEGERDDIFWRSAMSGGRATIGLREGIDRKSQHGDISAIAAAGEKLLEHFILECKFYKDFEIFKGMVKDNGLLFSFWDHLKQYCRAVRKQPLLIGRQNLMPPFVLITPEAAQVFGLELDHVSAILPRWNCQLILFDCFLQAARVPREGVYIPQRRRIRLT